MPTARRAAAGGDKYNERHTKAGKLLPRERVEKLIDPGAHFLELCPLAGLGVSGHQPGASVVGCVGVVSGIEKSPMESEFGGEVGSASEALIAGCEMPPVQDLRRAARGCDIGERFDCSRLLASPAKRIVVAGR